MLIGPSFLESSKQADTLLNCASELSRFRGWREDICHRKCLARLSGTQVVSGDASDQILRDSVIKTEGYPHKIEEGSPKIVEG